MRALCWFANRVCSDLRPARQIEQWRIPHQLCRESVGANPEGLQHPTRRRFGRRSKQSYLYHRRRPPRAPTQPRARSSAHGQRRAARAAQPPRHSPKHRSVSQWPWRVVGGTYFRQPVAHTRVWQFRGDERDQVLWDVARAGRHSDCRHHCKSTGICFVRVMSNARDIANNLRDRQRSQDSIERQAGPFALPLPRPLRTRRGHQPIPSARRLQDLSEPSGCSNQGLATAPSRTTYGSSPRCLTGPPARQPERSPRRLPR